MTTLRDFGFKPCTTTSSTTSTSTGSSKPYGELVGEDRTFGGDKLEMELLPISTWRKSGANTRSKTWYRIRNRVLNRTNHTCEFCGESQSNSTPDLKLEAHEMFQFIPDKNNSMEKTALYKLVRIASVCKRCHNSIHMGYSRRIGIGGEAKEHLKRVRGWSDEEFNVHNKNANSVWQDRNKYTLQVDLSLLTNNGCVEETVTPSAMRRSRYADNWAKEKQHFVETALTSTGCKGICNKNFSIGQLKLGILNDTYPTSPRFKCMECFKEWLGENEENKLRKNMGPGDWETKTIEFDDFVQGCDISQEHKEQISTMLHEVVGGPSWVYGDVDWMTDDDDD
jgi:hypothetical protein